MPEREPVVEDDYLGLSVEAARTQAEQAGWRVRIYAEGSVLTADRRSDRLNLKSDATGVVVEAQVF